MLENLLRSLSTELGKRVRWVAVTLLVVSSLVSVSAAQDTEADQQNEKLDVSAVTSAKTALELSAAYASLLRGSDQDTLAELETSSATGLALQAAWEELAQSVPRSPASAIRSERSGSSRINRVALSRFIGFVEGRLGVRVPNWWEEHLAIARVSQWEEAGLLNVWVRDTGRYGYCEGLLTGNPEELAEIECCTAGDISSIEVSEKVLSVHVDQSKFHVSRPNGKKLYVFAKKCDNVTAVALVHSVYPSNTLYKIDLRNGTVLWQRKLWCDASPVIRSGDLGFHWSEAVRKDDAIIVFGLRSDVVYIEAFEVSTGMPVFRFSTTYGWPQK